LRNQDETVLDRDSEQSDETDCRRHIERFSSQDQRKDAADEGVWQRQQDYRHLCDRAQSHQQQHEHEADGEGDR
jgi:hypothetical protein